MLLVMKCHSFPFSSMGSRCVIHLFAETRAEASAVAKAASAEVKRIAAKYSRYRKRNEVARLNRAARLGKGVEVDAESARLLDMAFRFHHLSGGLFDLSAGILRRVWDFHSGVLPATECIQELLPRIGMEMIRWNGKRLYFEIPDMELDFGGIAKEYAADRAARICRAKGMFHALVDLGGDLAIAGPLPDGSPWKIHVRHPLHRDEALTVIEAMRGGVATSGDYERCIIIHGKRYSHILNPKTGFPVQAMASVTVVAASCLMAGCLSTSAMLQDDCAPEWLAGSKRRNAWVRTDGSSGGTLPCRQPSR